MESSLLQGTNTTPFLSIFNKLVSSWILVVFLTLIIYFGWALHRGFELTDESYYLDQAIYPSAIKLYNSAQHWLISGLWYITRSLVLFRGIGMLILLLAAGILAKGAVKASTYFSIIPSSTTQEKIVIIISTLSGALLYGSIINFSPCYNLLASATSYSSMGLVLWTLGRTSNSSIKVFPFLTGCILGMAVLNKFSAGLCTFLLIIIIIITLGRSIRDKLTHIAFILIGLIITMCLFVFFHLMKSNVLEEFQLGMAVFKKIQPEATSDRLLRYAREFSTQVIWSGALLVVPIAFVSARINMRYHTIVRNLAVIIAFILGCFYVRNAFPLVQSDLKWLVIQSRSISLVLALSLIATVPTWTRNVKTTIFAVGLIALSYCPGIGTGNSIHTQIIVSLAPWGTIIAILAIASKRYSMGLAMIICALFSSLIMVQVFLCSLSPYHLNTSIWKQSVATNIGIIGTVETDKKTHDYVGSLTNAMENCNVAINKPFLGFYNLPGTALIIQDIPVFTPWLSQANMSEVMLNKVDSSILKNAVIGILLNQDGSTPQLPRQFNDFPQGYKICGEATYPAYPFSNQRVQIWVPINPN